jgi:type I restriction enzyme S subunit
MGLTKYKLGDLIYEIDRRNSDRKYGMNSVRGISNNKEITPTKASVTEDVIAKFYIIKPGEFIYNPRTTRMGEKVGMGFNDTEEDLLFSFNNIAFGIKNEAKSTLLPRFLYMYYNRPEFDRYAIVNSWGSATELFTFDEMCDIDIDLPPISIQQKYVDVYNAMLANQQSYERGLEDLKIAFDSILDKEKHKAHRIAVGELLKEIDNRNDDGTIEDVEGINITKQFMPTVANTTNINLNRYKVVQKNQIAYSGMQTGRDKCIRIALQTSDKPIIVSPAYTVFEVKKDRVLPEFIMMWFSRAESDRRGWFMSDSSVRSNLDLDRFYETEIPVPPIDEQRAIVDIYQAYLDRRSISDRLKERIKNMCPILIKGSLEEAGV